MEYITTLIDELTRILSNPLIVFFLTALLSIIIGFFIAFCFRETRKPCYYIENANVFMNFISRIDKLNITYARKKIKTLSVSKIAFWNAGRKTIDNKDIAVEGPVKIYVDENHEILDEPVIIFSNPINAVSVVKNSKREAILKFDYLDKNEGFIVQVFHTAGQGDRIYVSGKIKGVKRIVDKSVGMRGCLVAVILFGAFFGAMIAIGLNLEKNIDIELIPWWVMILSVLVFFAIYTMLLILINKLDKLEIPKKIRKLLNTSEPA